MKKTLASGLLAITVLSSAITFSAVAAGPTGGASNVPISFDGAAPTQSITSFILNDTTWVSIRDFAEAMGSATVTWSPSTAIVAAPNLTITATVGEQYIIAQRPLSPRCRTDASCWTAPSWCPSRSGGAYDAAVTWIPTTKTVLITTGSGAIAPASVFYNDNDVYWLSHYCHGAGRASPAKSPSETWCQSCRLAAVPQHGSGGHL